MSNKEYPMSKFLALRYCRSSEIDMYHNLISGNMEKREKTTFDLEERLIEFAVRIIEVAEALPKTFVGKHIGGQIVRSGTSPALNYGEAQAAESRSDFIHKMKVCLKELRETIVCMKIIKRKEYFKSERLDPLLRENDQLIAIFIKSIITAQNNSGKDSN